MGVRCENLYWMHLTQRSSISGCFEHGNECSGPMKGTKFRESATANFRRQNFIYGISQKAQTLKLLLIGRDVAEQRTAGSNTTTVFKAQCILSAITSYTIYFSCCSHKIKGQIVLCLINQTPSHEDVFGSGGIAPPSLTSALGGVEWSASHPGRFSSSDKSTQYSLVRKLLKSHSCKTI
jgi:hypothetical protein